MYTVTDSRENVIFEGNTSELMDFLRDQTSHELINVLHENDYGDTDQYETSLSALALDMC